MGYIYKHFIKENTAPKDSKKIGVYNSKGARLCGIMQGNLAPTKSNKLYSFGIISDSHIMEQESGYSGTYPSLKLETALTWFEEQGAKFVCHCGDITNHGFWNSDGTKDLTQFAEYKRICDLHPNLPVYACCGNHDSYFGNITETLTDLQEYTGHSLYYSIPYDNDLFIFIGQPAKTTAMNDTEYQWLTSTLEANNGKRCFIFVHPFFSNDSGNPKNTYETGVSLDSRPALKTLLSQHNTMLFHGHSHFRFDCQEVEETAIYTDKNGFRSMHIPSITAPAIVNSSGSREQISTESYGFLVDVYNDCVVFNARDFGIVSGNTMVNPKWLPISTYKIDMA